MTDYFLQAPDKPTMQAVLTAVYNASAGPDAQVTPPAEPPEFSSTHWITHGFAAKNADGSPVTGYLAAMRLLQRDLYDAELAQIRGAGINVFYGDTAPSPPWIMWQ